MVNSMGQLVALRDLLERALEMADLLDDTLLGVVIDTALQNVNAKIAASKADE